MTEHQTILKGHSWLQFVGEKEAGISAFYRRFHKSPDLCIEGTIGNTPCFYVGPCPVVETKGDCNDNETQTV